MSRPKGARNKATIRRMAEATANPAPKRQPSLEDRYPGITAMLGAEFDRTVAAKYKLSRERVRQFRAQLGIAAANLPHPTRAIQIPPEIAAKIGTMSDRKLARESGIPAEVIRRHRIALGTPKGPRTTVPSRLKPFLHLVGTMPDREVCKLAGVAANALSLYRKRHPEELAERKRKGEAINPALSAAIDRVDEALDALLAEVQGADPAVEQTRKKITRARAILKRVRGKR